MKTLKVIKQNDSCCTIAKDIEVEETFNELKKNLPIVIIGAGPIGLAAAAHLVEQKTVLYSIRGW